MTPQISPIGSRYVLTTGFGRDGSAPQFYTGRGGPGWLGAKAEAFSYTEEGALRKAALLTRITGRTFWIEAA